MSIETLTLIEVVLVGGLFGGISGSVKVLKVIVILSSHTYTQTHKEVT